MKRLSVISAGLLVVAFTVFGCAGMSPGWFALIGGEKGMD